MNDEYKPTPEDVAWLKELLSMLKPNGIWIAPATGLIYQKTGENELTLKFADSFNVKGATEVMHQTKAVAKKAGITIKES